MRGFAWSRRSRRASSKHHSISGSMTSSFVMARPDRAPRGLRCRDGKVARRRASRLMLGVLGLAVLLGRRRARLRSRTRSCGIVEGGSCWHGDPATATDAAAAPTNTLEVRHDSRSLGDADSGCNRGELRRSCPRADPFADRRGHAVSNGRADPIADRRAYTDAERGADPVADRRAHAFAHGRAHRGVSGSGHRASGATGGRSAGSSSQGVRVATRVRNRANGLAVHAAGFDRCRGER